jgi:amino acid transporter
MLLAAVYGLFTLLIISLLVAASPESSVTSLEMVAAVGFLIVSVMVALIFLILLQTPFPEYLEERYL